MPTSETAAERPVQRREAALRFGKYQLHRLLARGGMGEVYLARLVGELGFEKQLVIKTILPELAENPKFIELFAAEAKTAVALSHGNIVPIYELGRAEDTFYIVMGYVDGPSVAQLLHTYARRRVAPRVDVALHILRGVLTGLAYAHREEPGRSPVVHRDISSRNVLIDRSGQVRIVDFGIALPAKVQVNLRAGSTGYIAPEQARAEAAEPSADVFSTACLLYELLTHRRAFPREGVWVMPDFSTLPDDLRPVLERALDLDPTVRPVDAGAMLQALAPCIARHAATFGDTDLAAHLREVFPDGWDDTSRPAAEGELPEPSPSTATQTFATRLTAVTKPTAVEAVQEAAASGPAASLDDRIVESSGALAAGPSRKTTRWPLLAVALLAAVGGGGLAMALAPRPSEPDKAERVAAQPRSVASAPATEVVPAQLPPVELPPPEPLRHAFVVEPADATVTADGRPLRPPYAIELPETAPVVVEVQREGYRARRIELSRDADNPTTIALQADKPKGTGGLRVLAPSVSWASVEIDGRKVDATPTRRLALPEGMHRVVVRCVPDVCPTERLLYNKSVRIQAGRTTTIEAE